MAKQLDLQLGLGLTPEWVQRLRQPGPLGLVHLRLARQSLRRAKLLQHLALLDRLILQQLQRRPSPQRLGDLKLLVESALLLLERLEQRRESRSSSPTRRAPTPT